MSRLRKGKTPLLIFPLNGNGLEALDCLDDRWDLVGFVDDTLSKQGRHVRGFDVFDRSALGRWPEARVLAVPGGPESFRKRREVIEGLRVSADRYATVIHPQASVSASAGLGNNVLVMAGVVITSNAIVGDHVCILANSVIHHDSVIGSWTLIGSGVVVTGNVNVGANCYLASGSTIRHGLTVGEGALVGLGSTLIRDVASKSTVAGNPARVLG